MANVASLQDQQRVEPRLRQLGSADQLRRLLAELDYQVGDEPVSTLDWKQDLTIAAREGNLRILARHSDFVVTYCRLPELKVAPEREVVTRLVRQYDRGLFVFADHANSHWHFINVKRDSRRHNRLVLRRIAVGPEEQLRTAIERIALLKVEDASWSGLEVEEQHEKAFDVEKVTEQFYRDYKEIFYHISGRLQQRVNLRTARAFAQQFMNRMMFLYFLQKKGWLDDRRDFVPWLWRKYQGEPADQGNFYNRYLDALFFQALNSPSDDLTPSVPKQFLARRDLPDDIKQVFGHLPYLNGGLFSILPGIDDQGLAIEDSEFENLLENLLERYNFTVSEDTPLDVEVAVNPEMLGKVYETLVLEEERGQAGIFYTPRVELDFMCRRSLIEYLDEEPIIDRPDLIRLLMNADSPDPDNPQSIPTLPPERWRQLRRKLEEVTVVDPACGSGAFLVGMMQVLSGLQRLICQRLGEPYHDFQVKKRIIGENLFGVDIKDWAVRVAELRLWLSLIIHASVDEVREDPGKPILPNMPFRTRRGDSLVQEVGGVNFSVRHGSADISPSLKGRITRLKAEKLRFYNNEPDHRFRTEEELKHEELAIFRAILDERIHNLQNKRAGLASRLEEARVQQGQLPGLARERGRQQSIQEVEFDKQIEALAEELERAQQARQALRTVQDIPFVWDIAFVEVYKSDKGGFDIVIGNPPYVRQEEIAPLNKDPQAYTADQWREEKRQYKEALQRSVQTHWGTQVRVGGRADYYVYFYLHGLALLRERGTFCFITSNSWLDVGYGADLQRFLLTNMEIKDIYDNHAKRSFASSDINTVIVLFRRPPAGADLPGHKARFVAFKRPFEAVLTADNLTLIEWADSIQRTDDLRVYPLSQGELWQAGLASEDDTSKAMALGFGYGQYQGDKWGGKYLRAPDIFFTILEKGKGKLVGLGDIAEVRRGFTTGANEFFYLEPTGRPAPQGLVHVRNGAGWEGYLEEEFLRPVIASMQQVTHLILTPKMADLFVLFCQEPLAALKGRQVAAYISYGASLQTKKGAKHTVAGIPLPEASTLRGRALWYALPVVKHGDFVIPRLIRERFFFADNSYLLEVGDMFFGGNFLRATTKQEIDLGVALLNSTLTYLCAELLGRINVPGRINFYGPEINGLLLPGPGSIPEDFVAEILSRFRSLSQRAILPAYREVQQADRQEFDDAVLSALGLADLRAPIYAAFLEHVQARLEKEHSAKGPMGLEQTGS